MFLQGYGPKCSKVLGSGVTAAEKAEIVRAHNEYRARLANGRERRGKPGPQPPAADMQQMVSAVKKCIIQTISVIRPTFLEGDGE